MENNLIMVKMAIFQIRKDVSVARPTIYRPEFISILQSYLNEEHYTLKDMTITKSDGTQIDKTEREAQPPIFLSTFAKYIAPLIYKTLKKQIGFIASYRQIFSQWAEKHPEFNDALKAFEEYRLERIQVNGSLGLYNASFAIFTMKNIGGWRNEENLPPKEGSTPIETILVELLKKRTEGLQDGEAIKITRFEHRALDKFVSK